MVGLDPEQRAQESRVGAAQGEDGLAQLVGKRDLAEHALEVEQHVGELERHVAAARDPAGHLLAPLAEGLAPDRVDRHHPAPAEREAELVQMPVHAGRELDEEGIDPGVLGVRIVGEDEAVVLIGEQIALAAPARAHHDRGEGDRRRAPALGAHGVELERQHPAMDVVVEAGDQALNFGRRHPVGDQVGRQRDLGGLDLAEAFERGLVGQPVDLLDQPGAGDRQRVVEIEHAGEPPAASTTGMWRRPCRRMTPIA